MGKAKKRNFNKYKQNFGDTLTREGALKTVVQGLKSSSIDEKLTNLIGLFGINSEELLEAGARYEDIKALKGVLDYD